MKNIILTTVSEPKKDCNGSPVFLTDETIEERKQKILTRMRKLHLDKLVIYGDVEHGSNFEYLVGFFTRFEEALLIIDKSGEITNTHMMFHIILLKILLILLAMNTY